MSERFNFYDVYGYLIPGFALLGLLWLPVGIASGELPALGLADALGGLLVAYVLGHVLSGIATLAFPSGRKLSRHEFRHPSDDMLDDTLHPKRASFNAQLKKKVKELFPDVDLVQDLPAPQLRELRDLVFRLCRDRLVAEDKGAYAEQFQGMYSMMRGITAASIVAAYYLLGWLVSGTWVQSQRSDGAALDLPMPVAVIGLLFAGLDFWLSPPRSLATPQAGTGAAPQAGPAAAAQELRKKRPPLEWARSEWRRLLKWARAEWPVVLFWLCVAAAAVAGFFVGGTYPSLSGRPSLVVALAAGAVFLAGRCYNAFQHFAGTFADTVYRNFLALPKRIAS
jgi:hypothetical protein